MAWSDKVDIADEYFHVRNDDPYWSENNLLGFTVPERKMCGLIYVYWRHNMNLVVAGPAIWDHTGEDVYNCLYFGWDQHLAIPEGAEMFDFELSNSMSCRMVKPHEEYHYGYDRHGVKLDLVWTALAPPHYMKLADGGEENPGIKNWVKREDDVPSVGHYEQAGHFTGTIEIHGETIEIDCGALRDRGWGPRHADIKDPLRGGWPYVFASAESGWHLYDPQLLPLEEDPIEGTTETVTHGFYIRDGVKAQVVSGERRAERGRDGRVLTQVIDAVDELGRELHATGKSLNWLKWPINSDIVVWWSLVRWEYDGQVVYGEDQDFMNFRHYRKLWEKLLARDPGILNYFPQNDPEYPPYGK